MIGYIALSNRVVLPEGRAADPVALQGAGGNAFFKVTYLAPEGNVTSGIIAGTYETVAIDGDDAPVLLQAAVTPNKRKLTKKNGRRTVYLKKTFASLFRASSTAWPAASDAATMGVMTRGR